MPIAENYGMSDEPKKRRDVDWKARWTFRGIGLLTIASFLATSWLVSDQPMMMRVIAKTLVPLGVFFGLGAVAWLRGILPF